mgnify:CR=1 FL=1|tara:strand:- start:605 stop:781 length:177 start_codon:yes stop_codon:yes gene_type:complete
MQYIKIFAFSHVDFAKINTNRFHVGLKIDKEVYDKYVELGFDADEWSKKNFGNKVEIV